MQFLSAAPRPQGGKESIAAALVRFPIHGANINMNFTLPKFAENFTIDFGIDNNQLRQGFADKIAALTFYCFPISQKALSSLYLIGVL